jgi:hypothetical protein
MSVVLSAPNVDVGIVPEEGGRIQSVTDRRSGRELLYQRTPPLGSRTDFDFMSGCPGGWDEMFPNDPPWRGHPDHGRVWSTRFEFVKQTAHRLQLRATLETPAVDLEREYQLLPPPRRGVRQDLTLRAREATGPFLWASHPMLRVGSGWSVRVEAPELVVDTELAGRFEPAATLSGGDRDRALTVPSPRQGWSEVLYASSIATASVESPDGRQRTRMSWDEDYLRHLWIVTVTGELDVDLCVLLEPCTSRPYRLTDAITAGTACSLAAGAEIHWWVELESLDG